MMITITKRFTVILMIFFVVGYVHLGAKNYFVDTSFREWNMAERKTFVIALYHVRSFLANKENAHISLQVNLCQLKNFLKKLVKGEYYTYKRYKKNESGFMLTCECKQYKNFLILSCLTYYLLLHISFFHTKKTLFNFIMHEGLDSFLHTFFIQLTKKIDFDWYDTEGLTFSFTLSDQALAYSRYPKKISFRALGAIFLLEKTDPKHTLFHTMELFIKRVFLPISLMQYIDSLDDIEELKEKIMLD